MINLYGITFKNNFIKQFNVFQIQSNKKFKRLHLYMYIDNIKYIYKMIQYTFWCKFLCDILMIRCTLKKEKYKIKITFFWILICITK